MRLVECISKVNFGKIGFKEDNRLHTMVAKSYAKNMPKDKN